MAERQRTCARCRRVYYVPDNAARNRLPYCDVCRVAHRHEQKTAWNKAHRKREGDNDA